jgi:hypothetical protein
MDFGAVADGCYILAVLARHPYGQAWLHLRGGTARALVLKGALEAGVPAADAAPGAPALGDGSQRAAALAAAQDLVEALLSSPVVEAPVDVQAFLAAMQLPPQAQGGHPGLASGGGGEGEGGGEGGGAGGGLVGAARAEGAAVRMATAASHDEFMEALVELQNLCMDDPEVAATMAATGRWQEPLQRFLEVRGGGVFQCVRV